MTGLLLVLACHTGRWTDDAALAPTLARMDADHDGRVTEAEYTHVAFGAPTFDRCDADADGTLDLSELAALVAEQDPVEFFPYPRRMRQEPAVPAAPRYWRDQDVLRAIRDEIVAKDAAAAVPDDAALHAATNAGDLASAEVAVVLAQLQAAADASAAPFPPSLRR